MMYKVTYWSPATVNPPSYARPVSYTVDAVDDEHAAKLGARALTSFGASSFVRYDAKSGVFGVYRNMGWYGKLVGSIRVEEAR